MAGEIKVGMSFGTYDATVESRSNKYHNGFDADDSCRRHIQSSYKFKDLVTGEIKATALRDYGSKGYYCFASFSEGSYTWGTTALADKNGLLLNKFDFIETGSQHAVDLNGNGKVDDGEIFSGRLNNDAYNKAKESGDLKNYVDYIG